MFITKIMSEIKFQEKTVQNEKLWLFFSEDLGDTEA